MGVSVDETLELDNSVLVGELDADADVVAVTLGEPEGEIVPKPDGGIDGAPETL